MTVISAMKFNNNEGAIVADEQSSTESRKYDIATKLHTYTPAGMQAVAGGSGAADVLFEVHKGIRQLLENSTPKTSQSMAELVGYVMTGVKRRYIEGYLQSTYGASEAEFQAGMRKLPDGSTIQIAPQLLQDYGRLISGEGRMGNALQNGILLLTRDSSGVDIYIAHTGQSNPRIIGRPYDCIGSGSETADTELYSFLEVLNREQRENIDPIEGTAALIFATHRAGERNPGVGGTPLISIIKGDKIITPNEQSSRLAAEIVRVEKKGLLPHKFRNEALQSLLYNNDFKSVEPAMWKATSDKKKLDLYLRGYKV